MASALQISILLENITANTWTTIFNLLQIIPTCFSLAGKFDG